MKKIALIALGLLAAFLSQAKARDAQQILDASGVKGGLIVAIGCDSPALLEKGPAYDFGSPLLTLNSPLSTDWPTYRRDAQRSGYQDLPAPDKPDGAWTRKLSPPITAPVVAGGMVVGRWSRKVDGTLADQFCCLAP